MAYWIDDGFDTWAEVFKAGTAATGLYTRCGAWISRNLTDGFIPTEVATMYGTREWIQKLLDVGLWETVGDGYRDVRYLGMNPTAEKAKARKAKAARRQALFRDQPLREAVRLRDQDMCRYCGIRVAWNDRKGPKGGTYDHVDPDGPNKFDNLVVCCRSCNSRKQDRTLEAAGMVMRPAVGSKSDLDPTQNGSGKKQVSHHSPSLPPSKEGEGESAPASPGRARSPDDAHSSEVEDLKPTDWRTSKAFGVPPEPALADTARKGAAAARAAIRKPATAQRPDFDAHQRLLSLVPDPPTETENRNE